MLLGALEIQMLANLAGLKRDMDQAKRVVSEASDAMRSALGSLGLAVSGAALVAWTKSAIDMGDEMFNLASKVGATVEELSSLSLAFRQAGVDSGGMQTAMVKMSKNIFDNEAAFKALGISVKDASGNYKSSTAVFTEVAEFFKGLPDGVTKTALATELFGKAGAQLIPVLNGGAAGLKAYKEQADELGATLSTEVAAAADAFNDALDLMKDRAKAVTLNGLGPMLPLLTEIVTQFGRIGVATKDASDELGPFGTAVATVLETISVLALNTVYVFRAIGGELSTWASQLGALSRGDFAEFSRIGDQWTETAKKMRDEVDAQSRSILTARDRQAAYNTAVRQGGVDNSYAEAEMRRFGVTADANKEAMARAALDAKNLAAEQAKAAAEAKKLADAMDAQAKSLVLEQAGLSGDFTKKWGELTQLYATGRINLQQLEAAQASLLAKQPAIKAAVDEEAKAREAAAAAMVKQAVAATNYDIELQKLATSINNQEAGLNDDFLGKWQKLSDAYDAGWLSVDQLTAAQKKLLEQQPGVKAGLDASTAAAQHLADVADKSAKAWDGLFADVGKGLTDALMRGFDSGKSFFQSFWDGIKNTFKTTALKLLISPVNVAVGSMLGGTAGMAQAAQGSSLLNGMGSWGSMIAGGASAFGGGLSAGFGALFGEAGFAGAMDAAGIAMGAGNIAGGLGTAAGALAPYAMAAMAAISILKSLDDAGTPHVGGRAIATNSGVRQSSNSEMWGFDPGVDAAMQKTIGGIAGGLQGTLGRLFGTFGMGDATVGLGFADDSSRDGAWGALQISRGGTSLVDWKRGADKWPGREFADGEQGFKDFMQAVANDTRAAIQSIGLPEWAGSILTNLGGSATLDDLTKAIDQIVAMKAALNDLDTQLTGFGGIFASIASQSDEATLALADMVGGIDQLVAKAQSFVEAYYTQDEQMGIVATQVRDALAAAGLDATSLGSRGDLRALLESLNPATQAEQIASILNIGGLFAQLGDYLDNANTTLGDFLATSVAPAVTSAIAAVTTTATDAVSTVSTASTDAVADVSTAGTDAVTAAAGDTSMLDAVTALKKSMDDVLTEIKGMRGERIAADAPVVTSLDKVRTLAERWDVDGLQVRTDSAEPLQVFSTSATPVRTLAA